MWSSKVKWGKCILCNSITLIGCLFYVISHLVRNGWLELQLCSTIGLRYKKQLWGKVVPQPFGSQCNGMGYVLQNYQERRRQQHRLQQFPFSINGHMFIMETMGENGQMCYQEFLMYPQCYNILHIFCTTNMGYATSSRLISTSKLACSCAY